jgi:uncharacterized glyoxalase superfamily protein PhnB
MAALPAQRLVPMLAYDDAPAALAFLCEAFGFEERYRAVDPEGHRWIFATPLAGAAT